MAARAPLGNDARDRIARLTRSLAHRGPDDATSFRAARVELGFRRLSIIDVAGGAQPLHNEDGRLALIFNGEIYNYRELQAGLAARGHVLRTNSDAEVVLHLFEEQDVDALHALRGMFAFALYDTARERLVLARDRVGEKPLYLKEDADRLWFSSELGALLRAGVAPFELDPVGVDRYFHFLYAPEPQGIVRGVRHLDAGTYLDVDLRTWKMTERRWWSLRDAAPVEGDPVALVRSELDTISRLVIRSDVPVGVALSGGLDSSAVTALAARAHGPGLAGFTVGYRGRPPSDERAQAASLATALGVPLHEAELDVHDMTDEFPRTVRERDEPIADIAGYGHRAVMKLAREHGVPVLLTGYGGDEVFWGYDWVRDAVGATARRARGASAGFRIGEYLRWWWPPRLTRRDTWAWMQDAGGLRTALRRLDDDRRAPPDRIVFYELSEEYAAAASRARGLYAPSMRDAVSGRSPAELFGTAGGRADLAVMDRVIALYLRSIGFAQGDRLAMAHSVEARAPLADHRLIELVVGLQKARPGIPATPKAWLRDAMRGVLPDAVLARPKQGFAPPVWDWHRALMGRYGSWLRDGELVARGILSPEGAAALAAQDVPRVEFATLPFAALTLEVWCRAMTGAAA